LGRFFGAALPHADFGHALLFKEPKQESVAVSLVQAFQSFIQERPDLLPIVFGFRGDGIHNDSLLFAGLAAAVTAKHLAGSIQCGAMEPSSQDDVLRQGGGFAGKVGKDQLRDVLRQVGIAIGLAEGRGIDEGKMPGNELAESRFGAVGGKLAQELAVIGHHFTYIQPRRLKSGQKKAGSARRPILRGNNVKSRLASEATLRCLLTVKITPEKTGAGNGDWIKLRVFDLWLN
jgi:hypothetical protein